MKKEYYDELLEAREDIVSNWEGMRQEYETLSLIPEDVFAISILGVPYDLYNKYYGLDSDKYSEEEVLFLNKIAKEFIDDNTDNFIFVTLKTLQFNCKCEVGGLYIIMQQLKDYLVGEMDED